MCMTSLNACLHISMDVTRNDTAVEGSVRLVRGTTPLERCVEVFSLVTGEPCVIPTGTLLML